MHILGQPKNLGEVKVLSVVEINDMVGAATGAMKQGVPPEIPTAMPIGLFIRACATLVKYREVLDALVAKDPLPDYLALSDKARELLDATVLSRINAGVTQVPQGGGK